MVKHSDTTGGFFSTDCAFVVTKYYKNITNNVSNIADRPLAIASRVGFKPLLLPADDECSDIGHTGKGTLVHVIL